MKEKNEIAVSQTYRYKQDLYLSKVRRNALF